MRGIIIIDGPDACGKTTLANAIKDYCKQCNIPYLYQHAEYRFVNQMFHYHEAIARKAIKFSQNGIAVIDRLYWSEMVYAGIYRGESKWPMQWRYFDRLMQKHAAINIIACPSTPNQAYQWHIEACKERSEMYKSDINIQKVADAFITIYNTMREREDYFWYNRVYDGPPDRLDKTVQYYLDSLQNFREAQLPAALMSNCYNILGYVPRADVLFVGDQLNNKGRHEIWPFWEYGYSSLFFTKILDSIKFDETRAVWTNFNVHEEEYMIDEILSYNDKLNVVCLSKRAKFIWQPKIGRKVNAIYHPSYVRRFGNQRYSEMVKEAIDAPAR